MGDTDLLEMLFSSISDGNGGTFDLDGKGQKSSMILAENFDWNTSFMDTPSSELDCDILTSLMDTVGTNLSDDVKEQLPQSKMMADHAYSATPSSPHSDSGISNGPSSPDSSNSVEEMMPIDFDKELFDPLGLKDYEGQHDPFAIDPMEPMLLGAWSDTSSSPELQGNESPIDFEFDDQLENSLTPQVNNITTCTDEATKVIKVLSVNHKRPQSLLHSKQTIEESPYPELRLSDEEKDLLRKEGISLPTHLPLTREEEKILRSVRRRIRNKASARNSRRKKQDYMEALEKRVKHCTDEKRALQAKVSALEAKNVTLIGQLKNLKRMVAEGTKHTARTGTCAMILALSFALVLLPNYESLLGGNTSGDGALKATTSGRTSRNLLSKPDDFISAPEEAPTTYMPLFKLNKMASIASPAKEYIDEPVDGVVDQYVHDPVDEDENELITPEVRPAAKVIHMEITQLSDGGDVSSPIVKNVSRDVPTTAEPKNVYRPRVIRMDIENDEL